MKRRVLERSSLRGLAWIFAMSRHTISLWLRTRLNRMPAIAETLLPVQLDDVLELDELWSFVGNKAQKRRVWLALCRRTRQVVAYWIVGIAQSIVRWLCGNASLMTPFIVLRLVTDGRLMLMSLTCGDIAWWTSLQVKPTMLNAGLTLYSSASLALPVRHLLFQNAMPCTGEMFIYDYNLYCINQH